MAPKPAPSDDVAGAGVDRLRRDLTGGGEAEGTHDDTPLASWYTQVHAQRLVDGPDEVHRWTIGRNVIRAFGTHGTTASATGGDLF